MLRFRGLASLDVTDDEHRPNLQVAHIMRVTCIKSEDGPSQMYPHTVWFGGSR